MEAICTTTATYQAWKSYADLTFEKSGLKETNYTYPSDSYGDHLLICTMVTYKETILSKHQFLRRLFVSSIATFKEEGGRNSAF